MRKRSTTTTPPKTRRTASPSRDVQSHATHPPQSLVAAGRTYSRRSLSPNHVVYRHFPRTTKAARDRTPPPVKPTPQEIIISSPQPLYNSNNNFTKCPVCGTDLEMPTLNHSLQEEETEIRYLPKCRRCESSFSSSTALSALTTEYSMMTSLKGKELTANDDAVNNDDYFRQAKQRHQHHHQKPSSAAPPPPTQQWYHFASFSNFEQSVQECSTGGNKKTTKSPHEQHGTSATNTTATTTTTTQSHEDTSSSQQQQEQQKAKTIPKTEVVPSSNNSMSQKEATKLETTNFLTRDCKISGVVVVPTKKNSVASATTLSYLSPSQEQQQQQEEPSVDHYQNQDNDDDNNHHHENMVFITPLVVSLTDSNQLVFRGTVSKGSSAQKGWGVFTHYCPSRKFEKRAATYQGSYERGKFEGSGVYRDVDDYVYTGEFKCSWRDGYGKACWPCGRVYEGEWQNDEMEGRGYESCANGDVYIGEFVGGLRNGHGSMTLSKTNTTYKGEWRNGIMHGIGQVQNKEGKMLQQGKWAHGKFVG